MRKGRSLNKYFQWTFALLAIAFYSCAGGRGEEKMLELRWNNPQPGEVDKGIYYLEINNLSDRTFDSGNFTLYFNSLHTCRQSGDKKELVLKRISGDYYSLSLAKESNLSPGAGIEVELNFGSDLIKYTSLPHGFYMVTEGADGSEEIVELDLQAQGSIHPEDLKRSADDVLEIPTAASRFERNAYLTSLSGTNPTKIVPGPARMERGDGVYPVPEELTINVDRENRAMVERFFRQFPLHIPVRIATEVQGTELRILKDAEIRQEESYSLRVSSSDGIEIRQNTGAGLFYALQSVKALFDAAWVEDRDELGELRILDHPRFPYRGLHIDVARNFHTKEEIFRMLDVMAMYKLNRLHLHLTDDEGWRVEIPSLPELTEVGGRRGHTQDEKEYLYPAYGSGPSVTEGHWYSRDDYRQILGYAAERHIEVIPELDVPGHARAAIMAMEARYRKFAAAGEMEKAEEYRLIHPDDRSNYRSIQGYTDNCIDPGLPSVYRFIETVTAELSDMYKDEGLKMKWLHLGGDEVPRGVWEGSPAIAEMIAENDTVSIAHDAFRYFFLRSLDILAKYDCRIVGWEEVVHTYKEYDNFVMPENKDLIPLAYTWNSVWGWGREDYANRFILDGFPVVLSNVTNLYFDLAYDNDPEEEGLFWGGFNNSRNVYEFTPYDLRRCAWADRMGNPVDEALFRKFTALPINERDMIFGIQGQLWAERIPTEARLHYMAFPKALALAERAWSPQPGWAQIENDGQRLAELDKAWAGFCRTLGEVELNRLDRLFDEGVKYRLPLPGAVIRDAKLYANVLYPGLQIRVSTDGSEPDMGSPLYEEGMAVDSEVSLRAFTSNGRGSRTVVLSP